MADGVEMISSAILGVDAEVITIGGKVYVAHPPTIRVMSGAARYLKKVSEIENVGDVVETLSSDDLAHALSWLVTGGDGEYKKFLDADVNELANGINVCLRMIDPGNFTTLSALSRNVRRLIAKPKS